MRETILFIHGYQSSSKTDKFTELPYYSKYAYDYDYDKDGIDGVIEQAWEHLAELEQEYDVVTVVGHSLGGYVAACISLNNPSVLIAPKVFPKDMEPLPIRPYSCLMVELDDEVFDIEKQKEYLDRMDAHVFYYEGGHHRINRSDQIMTHIDFVRYVYSPCGEEELE